MSLSSQLYRLQQIDSQLDQAHARLREINAALEDDSLVAHAKEVAAQADKNLQNAQKALHQAEDTVRDQRFKIEQTESTLYGGRVRIPKELQDMQNEAASLKKYLGVLEDRQLEAMLAVEEMETIHQQATAALQQAIGRGVEQQAGLKGEQNSQTKQVERLEVERQLAVAAIAPADLALYEQLRQQRRGIAVSSINQKACSSCGATLTPAVLQSAANSTQVVRCPSCGRILYAA